MNETILKQSFKKYKCSKCGHETEQKTNHYGQTYSWGHFNTCPKCPPHAKYPEFGGSTIWECQEKDNNMGGTNGLKTKANYTG